MKTGNLFPKKLPAAVLLFVCAALAAPQTALPVTLTGGATLTESTSVNNDYLGFSVAVTDNRMIAGAPGKSIPTPEGAGYAVIFDRSSSGTWSRAAKLTPDDGIRDDSFGEAVSVSGDRAIVGAPRKGGWRGGAYIFERSSSGTWSQVAKFTGEASGDAMGASVSISGSRAIVGAEENGSGGAVYIYRRNSSGTWSLEAKLRATANAGETVANFGSGVAISGSRAVVGAIRSSPDGSPEQAGAAYIFERNSSGTWSQRQKLTAGDKGARDYFGDGVAISSNGRAIVGARQENGVRGAAYIFERNSSGNYAQTAKLTASDRAAHAKFGANVSISADGNAAIVGTLNGSKVYVFKRDATGSWCQTQRLSLGNLFGGVSISNGRAAVGAPGRDGGKGAVHVYNTSQGSCQGSSQGGDQGGSQGGGQGDNQDGDQGGDQGGGQGDNQGGDQGGSQGGGQGGSQGDAGLTENASVDNDFLGQSVAVSGNRMIAGAPGRRSFYPGAGYALIFDRNSDGTWSRAARLAADDAANGDAFGYSVAVAGSRAIVGAPRKGTWRGAAYIFERSSEGAWSQVAKFTGAAGNDDFGLSVSISGDRAIVGARSNSLNGSAYVYRRNSSGTWSLETRLRASDGRFFDYFGESVSISGERAVVGAPRNNPDSGLGSSTHRAGSVYVFEISSGSWIQHRKLTASDRGASDFFGGSVAVSSDGRAIVGARGENGDRGAAYVFVRNPNGNYVETAKLTASARGANDKFGWSVAISGDGDATMVGTETAGKAYVFKRDAVRFWRQTWTTSAGNFFGYGVSISNDRAAAGAPWHSNAKGAAYVYNSATLLNSASPTQGGSQGDNQGGGNQGGTGAEGENPGTGGGGIGTPSPPVNPAVQAAWNEILNNLNTEAEASSVAVSSDTAIVGLKSDGNAQNGQLSGSALVFERDSEGAWSQTQKLTARDAKARGLFGRSVAVSGSRAAVGAPGDDTNGQLAGAVYVFDKSASGTWSQSAKLVASDGSLMDFLGRSVSVSGDTVIAGADGHIVDEAVTGAAYIFQRGSGGAWSQTKLVASDGESGDSFGESVSISGDRAVVGAPRVNDNGQNSGAVYIFERDSEGDWSQIVKLSPDDGERQDFFGESVSVSGDRIIAGSELDADEGLATGSAYIFERDSEGDWSQVRKLTAGDDAEVGDQFGESVSISGDRAVVGVDDADSAYVYKRDSEGAWALEEKLTPETAAADYFGDAVAVSGNRVILISSRNTASVYEISSDGGGAQPEPDGEGPVTRVSETVTLPGSGKLTANDGAAGDLFGRSVSVSGTRAIVGALGDNNNGVITGSAYVFEKGSSGAWTQASKLTASDAAANDGFGTSVSVSGDRAVVGALNADGAATDPGAAYVFERSSQGTWTQVSKLTASDAGDNDNLGTSVSISGDRAIVGNSNSGSNNSGAAYVFDRNSQGAWSQSAKLVASDGARLDEFGASVSISGSRAVVSAIGDDDNGFNSGSAYVFDRNSEGAWSQTAKLTPEDGTAAHSFGIEVSVSGDIAVAGAYGDGDNGTRAGAAYVFERSSEEGTWSEVSKLVASDGAARDTFGRYVSVSGNRIIVGAEINGDGGAASGSAYIFERNSDGSWSETTKLLAGDGAAGDLLGGSVAISGGTALIAAPGDDTGRGSVYVYEPSAGPSEPGAGSGSGPGVEPGAGADDRSGREVARLSTATQRQQESALSPGSGGCAVSSAGSGGDALLAALALTLIPALAGFRKRKRI